MTKPTQADLLLRHLSDHPGATSLEITLAIGIVNVTGRVSDCRARGHVIDCRKRPDGELGYYLTPKRVEVAREPVPDWIDPETWQPRDAETAPPCATCAHPKYHHHGERSRKRRCLYCQCADYAVALAPEPVAAVQEVLW